MPILFLSCDDILCEQDLLLMRSLTHSSHAQDALLYACPMDSPLVGMANSLQIPFWEMPKSPWERWLVLRQRMAKGDISYIHALDAKAYSVAKRALIGFRSKVSLVASWHDKLDLELSRYQMAKNSFAVKAYFKSKITHLFVSSPALSQYLQNLRKRSSVHYLPFSISAEQESSVLTSGAENILQVQKTSPKARFVFLMHNDLEQEFGFDVLLEALQQLKQSVDEKKQQAENIPEFEVRICGQGSLFEKIIQKATELGVEDKLAILGGFDPLMLYESSHALLCLSTDKEGSFQSIIRAWKYRLPILASDLPAHTRILLSGQGDQSALIYPKESADVLAESMLQVLQDASLRARLIKTGKNMLQKHDYTLLADKYLHALGKK